MKSRVWIQTRLCNTGKLFHFLLAVDTAVDVVFSVHQLGNVGQFLLGGGDATGVGAMELVHIQLIRQVNHLDGIFGFFQKLQNQSHPHVLTVEGLTEVGSPGIIVHLNADLVDPGQGM